jgi:hypothetical protein
MTSFPRAGIARNRPMGKANFQSPIENAVSSFFSVVDVKIAQHYMGKDVF